MTLLDGQFLALFLFLAIPFVLLKIIMTYYSLNELVSSFVLLIFGAANALLTKDTTILILFIALIGYKGVKEKTVLGIFFYTKLIALIICVFLSVIGVINNKVAIDYRLGTQVIRYAFGFQHPNQLGIVFLSLTMIFLYLKKRFFKLELEMLLWTFINIGIYELTKSRTTFIVVLFYLFLYYLNYKIKIHKTLVFISIIAFPICFSLIFVLSLNLSNSFVYYIDNLLQHRLIISNMYLSTFHPTLMGQSLGDQLLNGSVLDSGYLVLYLKYGLVVLFLIAILYALAINKIVKLKQYSKLIPIIIIAFQGITENVISSLIFNFTFIFIAEAIFQEKNIKVEK